MGTSQSSAGPGGKSPLVPPWADDQPQQTLPEPSASRFKSFRQAIGAFVANNDSSKLYSAIGHYARSSSGGSAIASRRLGSVTKAGANLFGVLSGAHATTGEATIDIVNLTGLPCEQAILKITEALTPEDGDGEKIRAAMNAALVEALDGIEVFDPQTISDDVIINTMINYLTESIFLQIVMDAGKAWNKAETAQDALKAEIELRELIKVIVDKHVSPRMAGGIRAFTRSQMVQIEKSTIIDIWQEWETYK